MSEPLFDKVLGLTQTVQRLKALAERRRLPQSLLFVGPPGVGKKLVARALAQMLVCERKSAPCGSCGPCVRMAAEQSESLIVVSPQQGTIRAENVREVISSIGLRALGRARIVIFEQAHRFNPQGANSLLKVLEEPPPGTYFILTATGVESVLPTLRSRSQCFRFPALSEEHLRKLFPDAPGWMTSGALGRLDDLHNLGEERLTATRLLAENLWTQLLAGKPQKAFETFRAEFTDKKDAPFLLRMMMSSLRDGWISRLGRKEGCGENDKELGSLFREAPDGVLASYAERLVALERVLDRHAEPSLAFESFLLHEFPEQRP